jgi:UDP-GlcNAc:undecaprenyl-phosphate GlcNAc-1-phosphate transferase
MSEILLIFLTALIFSIVGTPLARRIGFATGIVAIPKARNIHASPVPQLGGAAIYVGFVVALLFFGELAHIRELISILLGATLVSLFGLFDDRWELSASTKMIGQLLAAVILVLGGTQVLLFEWQWINWAITIVWVVAITNAMNLLDNMDGLSGGIAVVASAFFLLMAAMNRPPQYLVGAMAAALIGACIGFLRYNLNPATIFMGDTGSLFLGFILAALAIKLRFPANIPAVTWMVPVCVLALPIFDTSLVIASRLRRGLNPFTTPGKDHLSHRLVALGMTRREAVLTCYIIAGVFGMFATYLTQASKTDGYLAAAILAAFVIAAIVWLERICPAGVPRQKSHEETASP